MTVTFCPAGVVRVKPDAEVLSTVPDEPPAAGPDRALEPPAPALPPGMPCPAVDDVDEEGEEEDAAAAVEPDVEQPVQTAATAHTSAAAIPALFLFARDRRAPELPATDPPDGNPVSWVFFESKSLIAAFLLRGYLHREWQPYM
ncbi:hypothetical protein [Actinacidiphila paucisporea]|uniref:hypothetical protein n=1 Tax=Actinacidiphila paucisporea TaxID=310782 RepID=UPI00116140D4|nr:hypothetical protein [Actinacidiphila paucisporea]